MFTTQNMEKDNKIEELQGEVNSLKSTLSEILKEVKSLRQELTVKSPVPSTPSPEPQAIPAPLPETLKETATPEVIEEEGESQPFPLTPKRKNKNEDFKVNIDNCKDLFNKVNKEIRRENPNSTGGELRSFSLEKFEELYNQGDEECDGSKHLSITYGMKTGKIITVKYLHYAKIGAKK
jgi:uncharacterized coiled-coil DUF342 family protein